MKYLITAPILFLFLFPATGQTLQISSASLIDRLDSLHLVPDSITFKNSFNIQTAGGHLQGIQSMYFRGSEYFYLSGSSDSASYFLIVKSGKENRVVAVKLILGPPFKHAGGFQIFEDILAVGVEDNNEKNRSKVFIYVIDNPDLPPKEPMAIIERFGTFKRGTAGCVAVTVIDDKVLLVVGDWDTENLDFYQLDRNKHYPEGTAFDPMYSINMKKVDKTDWVSQDVPSYQNINFIKTDSGQLYLAGMGPNTNDENILDLFQMYRPDSSSFTLKKIISKRFPKNLHTGFRWGAGIAINPKGELSVLSTEESIDDLTNIYIYK